MSVCAFSSFRASVLSSGGGISTCVCVRYAWDPIPVGGLVANGEAYASSPASSAQTQEPFCSERPIQNDAGGSDHVRELVPQLLAFVARLEDHERSAERVAVGLGVRCGAPWPVT